MSGVVHGTGPCWLYRELQMTPSVPNSFPQGQLAASNPDSVTWPAGNVVARLLVFATWAAMVLAGLWFVGQRGFWLPWRDDYGYLMKVVSGTQSLTPGWLWERYGENRIPLAKTMSVALLSTSGYSFRAGAIFNVVALGTVAFAALWVAARIRGRPALADAVFPLLLLSWSQWEGLAWSILLPWVVAQAILLALLLLIALRRRYNSPALVLLVGGLIALLPVLGPSTLAYVPALAVWLSYVAIALWKQPDRRLRKLAVAIGGIAAATLALLVVYFLGFEKEVLWQARLDAGVPTEDSGSLLGSVLCLASMALVTGMVSFLGLAQGHFPLWFYLGTVLLAYYCSAAVLLCRAWWRQPNERVRAAGLLLFLGGTACLFFALDRVRGHGDGFVAVTRYAHFAMTPLLCSVYAWILYGPRWVAGALQGLLLCLGVAVLPLNASYGWEATSEVCQVLQSFADDLETRKPAYVLANHHCGQLLLPTGDPGTDEMFEDFLTKQFRGLRERGVSPFDSMVPDPEGEEVRLNADAPAVAENIEWDGDVAKGQDLGASLTFVLPRSRFVLAVRVRYRLENETLQNTAGQLVWQHGGDAEETVAPVSLVPHDPEMPPGSRVRWVWINARIDRLRLHPDEAPFALRLEELVLLAPLKPERE